jgi:guanosine-3',5'-bis(diphosphate) 3'-pyrophosphohydrolase
MDKFIVTLLDAISFAAERHRSQRRKGVGKVPYINHPLKVTKILSDCGEDDSELLISAILHDVIEDTTSSEEDIKGLSNVILSKFGEIVLLTVLEVSDNKSLPVEERKRLQVVNTPNLSERAKLLKIADKISNIEDIKNDPPENWTKERKLAYLDWAKEVVDGARGINKELEKSFDLIYKQTKAFLNSKS